MADHVWEHLHARFHDLCLQKYLVKSPSDEIGTGSELPDT